MDGDGTSLRQNVFSGSISLHVVSLSACQRALARIANKVKINVELVGEDGLKVTGPYGNTFFVSEAPPSLLEQVKGTGEHPGGIGSCIVSC